MIPSFFFKLQPSHSTIEDIFTAVIETERGVKEKVRIFDTGAAASVRCVAINLDLIYVIL